MQGFCSKHDVVGITRGIAASPRPARWPSASQRFPRWRCDWPGVGRCSASGRCGQWLANHEAACDQLPSARYLFGRRRAHCHPGISGPRSHGPRCCSCGMRRRLGHRSSDTISTPYRDSCWSCRKQRHGLAVAVPDPALKGTCGRSVRDVQPITSVLCDDFIASLRLSVSDRAVFLELVRLERERVV